MKYTGTDIYLLKLTAHTVSWGGKVVIKNTTLRLKEPAKITYSIVVT